MVAKGMLRYQSMMQGGKFSAAILLSLLILTSMGKSQEWHSRIVFFGPDDKLTYVRDEEGNRIPDFSYAGYKNAEEAIPDVPVVKTLSPVEGDNTGSIQTALFEIAMMPKQADGFRGALQLTAGTYEIRGTIKLQYDGVVLRGVGDGDDPATNTILKATGNSPSKRTVLIAGGGGTTLWRDQVSGSRQDIISDTVLVGDRSFEIADASSFAVGDNIIIYHPCTTEWLEAIDFGGTYSDWPDAEPGVDVPWTVGSQPLVFNRTIMAIEGNTITIDAPVYNHLIKSQAQSYIYKYARSGLKTNIGIEDLRIDIETANSSTDENHAWNAIDLFQIEDAWVRNCTMLHFGLSGIRTNTATRITVDHCQALDPVSTITGGNRYNFQAYNGSQLILFKNCHASNGRHHYMSNGTSWTSGIVFYNCTSEGAYASSEGHRRWTMGMLYDNVVELDGPRAGLNPRLLGLYNRGYYGTSHGWALAHSVAWNCDVANGDLIVQKPPTAQNYAIGCFGKNITGQRPPAPFPDPEGYIEGSNTPDLNPKSLYIAQLVDRLGPAVGIMDDTPHPENIVSGFELYENYPNPFNPSTVIRYHLPQISAVRIIVYNSLGQLVRNLVDRQESVGDHTVTWDGRDQSGQQMGSGIYFCIMKAGQTVNTRKMMLLK